MLPCVGSVTHVNHDTWHLTVFEQGCGWEPLLPKVVESADDDTSMHGSSGTAMFASSQVKMLFKRILEGSA